MASGPVKKATYCSSVDAKDSSVLALSMAVTSSGISWTTTRAPSSSGSGESMTKAPNGPRSTVTSPSSVTS